MLALPSKAPDVIYWIKFYFLGAEDLKTSATTVSFERCSKSCRFHVFLMTNGSEKLVLLIGNYDYKCELKRIALIF